MSPAKCLESVGGSSISLAPSPCLEFLLRLVLVQGAGSWVTGLTLGVAIVLLLVCRGSLGMGL